MLNPTLIISTKPAWICTRNRRSEKNNSVEWLNLPAYLLMKLAYSCLQMEYCWKWGRNGEFSMKKFSNLLLTSSWTSPQIILLNTILLKDWRIQLRLLKPLKAPERAGMHWLLDLWMRRLWRMNSKHKHLLASPLKKMVAYIENLEDAEKIELITSESSVQLGFKRYGRHRQRRLRKH